MESKSLVKSHCGHDPVQFVSADEGTSYCPACERAATTTQQPMDHPAEAGVTPGETRRADCHCTKCSRALSAVELSFGMTACMEWRKCYERQLARRRVAVGLVVHRPFEWIMRGVTG